jgi:uncharacterized protein VirK/YbjX
MNQAIDFSVENFDDKMFHTFRKTRNFSEPIYSNKWNMLNVVNQHYVRRSNQVLNHLTEHDLPRKIYQSRPSLVLNIDNEFMTLALMNELRGKL